MTGAFVIYCDASVSHPLESLKNAAWGAVFVRGEKVVGEASGKMRANRSSDGELKAVRYALEYALERGLCACESVIVASDCDGVELYLSNRQHAKQPDFRAIADGVLRVADKAEVELIPIWVKGHAPASLHGPHNCRADKLAKIAAGIRLTDEELERRQQAHNAEQRRKVAEERAARKAERAEKVRLQRAAAVAKYGEDSNAKKRRIEFLERKFAAIAEVADKLEGRA